jgi:hypothetical protein
LTDRLTLVLASEELKGGQRGLQSALVDLIKSSSASDVNSDEKRIKPQLISTVPVLVDFPPLLKPFVPRTSRKQRIYAAVGMCTMNIILGCQLVGLCVEADLQQHWFFYMFDMKNIFNYNAAVLDIASGHFFSSYFEKTRKLMLSYQPLLTSNFLSPSFSPFLYRIVN